MASSVVANVARGSCREETGLAARHPRWRGRCTLQRGTMADVQIQQPSGSGSGSGGSGLVWAVIVLILIGVIAWLVFGGGLHRTSRTRIDINVPNAGAPASGSAPSGSAPPLSGGAAPAPKTP